MPGTSGKGEEMAENILWMAPSFLWEEALKDKDDKKQRLNQPAVFRFDNDSFMEELEDRLEKNPSSLKDLVFLKENWIEKRSGWLPRDDSKYIDIRKLYQPTHGFFYVAAAMLICRIPGFPDRKIDISNEEKASFLMRRLVPSDNKKRIDLDDPASYIEYGIIEGKGWRKASRSSAASDEERLPLFPMYFTENNVKRRLLAGVIPVSKKETYQSEPEFKYEALSSVYLDNGEKDELATEKTAFLEFKNKIILACVKLMEYCGYLFCWNGTDEAIIEENIKSFLKQDYYLNWVKDATFTRDNARIIRLTSGTNKVLLSLNLENTEIELKINNAQVDKFIIRSLNGYLNIYYEKTKADKILALEILQNIVLDMDEYLEDYLGEVWKMIHDDWRGGSIAQKALYYKLGVEFAPGKKWSQILQNKETIGDIIKDLNIEQIATSVSVLKSHDDFASFLDIVDRALPDKKDARILLFEKYAARPFAALYAELFNAELSGNARSDEGVRRSFLFILLDFAGFLSENLGNVFSAIIRNDDKGLEDPYKKVFSVLKKTVFYGEFHWDDVLREIWDNKYAAISGKTDIRIISGASAKNIEDAIRNLDIVDDKYSNSQIYTDIIASLGKREIPSKSPAPINIDKTAGALFFLRFVYDRPKCRNISESIVSEPTQPFQLAHFYDPDAPSRPLKITMPVDTSIDGLKKYPRNVSFIISNKLRNQMELIKASKLIDLDNIKPPEKKPLFNLGMICSFSIPIITICALILLMIMVNLLNIIFWWLPYFRICFPLNLKLEK